MGHLHLGHPCTLVVPHLHYPDWLFDRLPGTRPSFVVSAMLISWWPDRRPR